MYHMPSSHNHVGCYSFAVPLKPCPHWRLSPVWTGLKGTPVVGLHDNNSNLLKVVRLLAVDRMRPARR